MIIFINEKHQLEYRKSLALKESRGICFEDVVFYIEKGDILDDYLHPNQKTHPGLRIMVVSIANYAYLIPMLRMRKNYF